MEKQTIHSAALGMFVIWITAFVFMGIRVFLNTETTYTLYASEKPDSGSEEALLPEATAETNAVRIETEQQVPVEGHIEQYIIEVFGDDYEIALAIAKAESGLNPKAYNDNRTWGGVGEDRGIFQINNVYWPKVSDKCAYEPKCNIKWAKRIYDILGFRAWSAYKNNSYKKHL